MLREVPARHPLATVAAMAITFVGGAPAGVTLAEWLAPESELASAISFALFPASMILGFQAWLGLAVLLVIPLFIKRLLGRTSTPPKRRGEDTSVVPPGAWVFCAVSVPLSLAAGLVVGVLSSRATLLVAAVYLTAGVAYGVTLWLLARSGYLPFPDSA